MTIEQHYRLETPEQIEVDFDLAGPGSRFCAILIDWLMVWLVAFVVLLTGMAGFSLSGVFGGGDAVEEVGGWLAGLLFVLLGFLGLSGYHVLFEMVMGGQTPGKKSLGLRVIREDGTPISFVTSLTRNLLRIVDWLPVFYAVGGLISALHPMHKRLGDLAAGTIVVKESEADYRSRTDTRYELNDVEAGAAPTGVALSSDERRMVQGFLQRRSELLPQARANLAQRLASDLHRKHGGHLERSEDAELYLESLMGEQRHAP